METSLLKQLVGQHVNGCYVERFVRRGQMSTTYLGLREGSPHPVAVTLFLLPQLPLLAGQRFRSRFLKEASSLASLNHKNLLPLYGYGEWEGLPYLVTPYRTEGSLLNLLKQQERISYEKTVTILEQVAAGLEYAHRQGHVHGSLTPAHLLVSQEEVVQIGGMGLLRLLERRGILPTTEDEEPFITVNGVSLAQPKYAAPEYLQGNDASIRSDIYALGVILLELLTGLLPRSEVSPLEVLQDNTALPPGIIQVLERALATDPTQRFHRVGDLLTAWASGVEREDITKASTLYTSASTLTLIPTPTTASSAPEGTNEWWQSNESWMTETFEQRWSIPPRQSTQPPVRTTGKGTSQRREKRSTLPRRRVVALLASGVVLAVVGGGEFGLTHLSANKQTGSTTPQAGTIGHTQQPPNTAVAFNHMSEQTHRQSLLIRLPSGSFVAYKQGCTHTGVLVNYDPKTHLLVCPAHGAIFDPAHGGGVVKGPATLPLPSVSFKITQDGSIISV